MQTTMKSFSFKLVKVCLFSFCFVFLDRLLLFTNFYYHMKEWPKIARQSKRGLSYGSEFLTPPQSIFSDLRHWNNKRSVSVCWQSGSPMWLLLTTLSIFQFSPAWQSPVKFSIWQPVSAVCLHFAGRTKNKQLIASILRHVFDRNYAADDWAL